MNNLLIDAIYHRLSNDSRHLALPLPSEKSGIEGQLVSPSVFKWFLPPKESPKGKDASSPLDKPEFPHIIIRNISGTMSEPMDVVQVKFILGGFSEDSAGCEWIFNILDRISLNFQQQPVFDSKYEFQRDFQWKLFDDQPYPFWVMEVIGSWSIIKPQSLYEMETI